MRDAVDEYNRMKKDISILRLLFLLVFPKTLMLFVFLGGYMWYIS